MQKQAVIIYGPPGSGKERRRSFWRGSTISSISIRGVISKAWSELPDGEKNAVLRRERRIFDSGVLCTPSWVFNITAQFAGRMAKLGYSIVFSGSPRTLPEAFGKKDNGLAKVLERLYGKGNVAVIQLQVSEKASLNRNSHRLVCSVCGLPLLGNAKIKICTFCAGKMRTRSLDKPEVIKVRLKEYHNRTYPIIAGMKKRNFKVFPINGEPCLSRFLGALKKR